MSVQHQEAFVIRTDTSGRVVGQNARADELLGRGSVGSFCDAVVRGISSCGVRVCNTGCAAALATGAGTGSLEREVEIRGKKVRLRCLRVGEEAVIIGEQVGTGDATEQLTAREREVVGLLAEGLSTASIASRLGISPATVRTHVEHARGRLGARTRAEAVVRAIQTGQLSGIV